MCASLRLLHAGELKKVNGAMDHSFAEVISERAKGTDLYQTAGAVPGSRYPRLADLLPLLPPPLVSREL